MPDVYIVRGRTDIPDFSRFCGVLNLFGVRATSGSYDPRVMMCQTDFVLAVLSESSIPSGLKDVRAALQERWLREDAEIICMVLDQFAKINIPDILRGQRLVDFTDPEKAEESWADLLEALGIPHFIQMVITEDMAFIERLLDQGVDVNMKDHEGRAALWWAVYWRQTEFVHNLLERGANPNVWGKWSTTPLYFAAQNDDSEIVRHLLDKGANPNITDFLGRTPLMITGTTEIARMLLAKGADVNIRDSYGASNALMSAAYQSYSEIVRILIDHGAALDVKDDLGKTALMKAVGPCHIETVRVLCDQGADVNAKGDDGETALTIARSYGHEEIVKILFEAGATE